MPLDLSSEFTNAAAIRDDLLGSLVQQMKIRIIGRGIKDGVVVYQINNYILPSFLLIYNLEGSMSISHAGQTTKLAAGSFYLHEPFEIYTAVKASMEPVKFLFVNFDIAPLSLREIFKLNAFLSSDSLFRKKWYSRIGQALQDYCTPDALKIPGNDTLLKQAIKSIVAHILSEQMRGLSLASLPHTNEESRLIDRTFAYTEQHMDEPINLGRLVRDIGTSRSSLYRAFQNGLHVSPLQALTRFKIERALDCMENCCSVKETAKMLGYSSTYHFSNTFKAIMGKRPTDYILEQTTRNNPELKLPIKKKTSHDNTRRKKNAVDEQS